ncbi:4-hydroxy-tetrahydrodipicolinate synthase [Prauserella muralis]|uniref:4-hydroxy-tetrahydrodipicolinate synthase n=1 Tax=Prauserella muralis TaxID=588067 RepID=A0A2V4AFT4_9PSEU|nr:4-hydroxy-tetrahydrodipicolinate synthase [Prauserella muralis]PXY18805.1 4-hydroxy-tetrahydrodipicolinate synthase [Prauserella muralis]TWE28655.1 4-hydroxy-tetrahydrodipicolinate synthase [Prauserella muralis]
MSLRTEPRRLRGSIAPLMTPFTTDGEVDHESLANAVRWQIASGSHGLSIGGSTGEPSAQSIAERLGALKTVLAASEHTVPVIPGTGTTKLDETIELTRQAAELGADAALVITPYYARPTQEALYRWYATVAAEVPDLPILAYNVPSRTSVDIAPETVERLYADVPNFVGIKETTRDFEHFSRVLQRCGRDLVVWSGIELLCLPLLALGGAGFLSATANIAPAAHARMFDLWSAGDHAGALEIHYGLHPLVDLIFTETNPAAGKWVLEQLGVFRSGHVRPPLIPLTEAGQSTARTLLAQAGQYVSPVADEFTIGAR